ncbi:MAG: family 20 glycosylhydrolase [Bacteroidaceae bacterium]|nr:family 20 glycosylhydrolase [Bacteroidaceae bacterium]
MKKTFLLLLLGLLMPLLGTAKVEHLLPMPQSVTTLQGEIFFRLGRAVCLDDPTDTWLLRHFFEQHGGIREQGGPRVKVALDPTLGTFDYALPGFPDEGYSLIVTKNAISIRAVTQMGVIRATQTLMQLAEGWGTGQERIEAVRITDFPAFKLRGWMHDVGRSYISVEELKREIDLLARFKINVFHWHLTENQAWRFEVKAFPQLTADTSMTRLPGKYYTQAECSEIETYAAQRGVTVIPEIDMPGHSAAFRHAMGFDMQTDEGVAVLKKVLAEVIATFPRAPYIHLGGDEVRIHYPQFLPTLAAVVRNAGKHVVTWNRLVNIEVSPEFADMTQMWATSGKKISGLPNIDCRYVYTNHMDVFADLVGIFRSNIYYEQRGNPDVAGTIVCTWNDRQLPAEADIISQNNLYAYMLVTAWRAWRGGGLQYIEDGGTMLPESGPEYDEFCEWEQRFLFHKAHSLAGEPVPYVKQTNVHWRITDAFPNGGDAARILPPDTLGPQQQYTLDGQTYTTRTATGAGIYLRHTWAAPRLPRVMIPTFFNNSEAQTTAYAWTYVWSPSEQTLGAQVEFYNYGRSERDLPPQAGQWDRYGSRIWVNGQPLAPPAWDNAGLTEVSSETLLQNENFPARNPLPVTLRAGWNTVFIKLPFNPDGGQRLKKWMFTFVLTDLDGRNAAEGIRYSSAIKP